jgi:hypothetical protein
MQLTLLCGASRVARRHATCNRRRGPEGHTLGTRTGASKRGCSRRTGPGSWTRRGLALGSPVVGGQGGEIRCSAPRITAFHATVKCSRRFRKKPRPRGWPEPRGRILRKALPADLLCLLQAPWRPEATVQSSCRFGFDAPILLCDILAVPSSFT